MKKTLLASLLVLSSILSYSQSEKIIGSWYWRDSVNSISFFIKDKGVIEKRGGLINEDIWSRPPQKGKYTFTKESNLSIIWADKRTENGKVKFVDKFTIEIQFTNPKSKAKQAYIFKKIVDEEVISDK